MKPLTKRMIIGGTSLVAFAGLIVAADAAIPNIADQAVDMGLQVNPATTSSTCTTNAKNVTTCNYAGAAQTVVVPQGVQTVMIDAVGGQGGQGGGNGNGPGAWVNAELPVSPGQVLTVGVGGDGGDVSGSGTAKGGWGGMGLNGGDGASDSHDITRNSGGGGGATTLQLSNADGSNLTTVVVAGGGGGNAGPSGDVIDNSAGGNAGEGWAGDKGEGGTFLGGDGGAGGSLASGVGQNATTEAHGLGGFGGGGGGGEKGGAAGTGGHGTSCGGGGGSGSSAAANDNISAQQIYDQTRHNFGIMPFGGSGGVNLTWQA